MKKKHIILSIVVLLVIYGIIWWNIPAKFLKFVISEDISTITVRNGNTGAIFEIDKEEDISYIVENIQQPSFSTDSISLFHMGTLFTLTFYDKNGKRMDKFILNGHNTIRQDPFFYRTDNGNLQDIIDYLNALETDLD